MAEATRATLATVPGGANVSKAPLTVPRTAEIALSVYASMAANGEDLSNLTIEITNNDPEIAFAWSDGKSQRFQPLGTSPNHQPARGRVAVWIPGAAFSTFVQGLAHA